MILEELTTDKYHRRDISHKAIAHKGTESDRDPWNPSTGLKNHRRVIVLTDTVQNSLYTL